MDEGRNDILLVENDEDMRLITGYSWQIAFVYVFNLIVGAGALALPKAFAHTGWILGLIALGVLALMSYCTSTFMIEAMAIANGVLRCNAFFERENISKSLQVAVISKEDDSAIMDDDGESVIMKQADKDAFINDDDGTLYEIAVKVEMGEMAKLFFNKAALVMYYVVICLYLFGDLAIYCAAVPKSMTTIICGDPDIFDYDVDLPCQNVQSVMKNVSVMDMYRIMLLAFTVLLCPFIFDDITKTKLLQISTTIFRWLAFITMIILGFLRIVKGEGKHRVKMFEYTSLPHFFGVAVYSFMCQHSLPSIVTPVTNKKRLNMFIFLDFILVAVFYAMLVLSAVFAFPEGKIEDLYSLNFSSPQFLRYFLEFFPVLTLSTTFPIIGITLRENLKSLFLKGDRTQYGLFVTRFLFPLVTIIPPIIIAYVTYDVGMLVNITGTYAGAIIQYVIPVMLVYYGRKRMKMLLGTYVNKYRSPFRRRIWIFFIIGWYVVCLIVVTVNIFSKKH